MSTTISYFEQLQIKPDCTDTAKMIQVLGQYITQFNYMEGIESVSISRLELCNGDKAVLLKEETHARYANTWNITSDGIQQKSAKIGLWPHDSSLLQLLESLDYRQPILFRFSGSVTYMSPARYGPYFWYDLFSKSDFIECTDYKGFVAADTDETVSTVIYNKDGLETELPRNESLDHVSGISKWYGENFSLSTCIEDESKYDEFSVQMEEVFNELINYLGDDNLFADIFEESAQMVGPLVLHSSMINGLVEHIQNVADTAHALGGKAELLMDLLPNELPENGIEPFAVLRLSIQDGRTSATCCRLDK